MPIFDQGYQHWQGPLSGRLKRWLTIARHGVRVQRNNRILRIFLLFSWLPAIGLIVAMVLWGMVERKSPGVMALLSGLPGEMLRDPQAFRATAWTLAFSTFFTVQLFFIMLLVAIAGPGLISQDLRFNALPLYFARPLTRLDYFLGKLGVIGALVASIAVGPAVFAYVVGLGFCLDLNVIKDTYPILLGSVAYGLVITLSAGTLILAMSSLTRRSLYVGITWAGMWIISSMLGKILPEIHRESMHREIEVAVMNRWYEEHPPPQGAQFFDTPMGRYPRTQTKPGTGQPQLVGIRPQDERASERWFQAWSRAVGQAGEKATAQMSAAAQKDWRPMCSYVANLERMADLLLDTDSAWVHIGRSVHGASGQERRLADQLVPQYPWWWSAAVLAALMGLSTWILTRRVKSLDRLR